MHSDLAAHIVQEFERGVISRRQLIARLTGLGAAAVGAGFPFRSARAQEAAGEGSASGPMFQATGLDHIALSVTDVARSKAFYEEHLGLRVQREGGADNCFMGPPGDENKFILALFRTDKPAMNHYCYALREYNPDEAVEKLKAAGIEHHREGGRVYFMDPDGLEVQISG